MGRTPWREHQWPERVSGWECYEKDKLRVNTSNGTYMQTYRQTNKELTQLVVASVWPNAPAGQQYLRKPMTDDSAGLLPPGGGEGGRKRLTTPPSKVALY